jgi:protein gp37
MKTTKIEWMDKTWNPVTGCTKRSIGYANCYAENMARRLCAMGQENPAGFASIKRRSILCLTLQTNMK